jgi:Kef-type K+ transport system membrane component KefB
VILLALAAGQLARRLGQPPVVGELAAGIALDCPYSDSSP